MICTQARSIREIDEARWDAVTGGVLQMTHRWLRVVEASWRFYQPLYLLLEDENGPCAAALANTSITLEKRFGFLGCFYQLSSLIVRPPFASRPSVVVRPGLRLDAIMPELNAAFGQLSRQERRLLIAVGNIGAADVSMWQAAGFLAVRQPSVSLLDVPATYDDYLQSLPGKDRRELQRIRRRADELGVRFETGPLGDDSEKIYALLSEVYAKHGVKQDAIPFTPQLLVSLAQEMPDEVVLIRGYFADELVGVFLNLLEPTMLLAFTAGLRYEIARPTLLYFLLLDESIRLGIQRGVSQVYVGRTNEREKRRQGFSADERWLCCRAGLQPLNRALMLSARFFPQLGGPARLKTQKADSRL